MVQDEELEQLRAERTAWRDIAHEKHHEVLLLQQEKQIIREALKEAFQAIERLQTHTKSLEGQIGVLQERVKILEGQLVKDSHNSSLPRPQIGLRAPLKTCAKRAERKLERNKATEGTISSRWRSQIRC